MRPTRDAEFDAKLRSIHAMLHPASIAVVGATERLGYGGRFFNNLLKTGCKARLYPVNPKRDTVFGVRCFHSVNEIPEPVDLAAIIIPAAAVVPAFRECVENGAKSALVVSSGFAELGTEESKTRQAELRDLARQNGVGLCGPNCLGLTNIADGNWTTPSTVIAPQMQALNTEIGLVSQSGATAYRPLMTAALDRGIGFRYVVATGNEADLEASDFMRYMLRDPAVKVVTAVVEAFRDGAKFVETAELAVKLGKPLIILKVGRSEAGSRGARSHTAAMTGSDVVQDALFRQKGVVRVDDYDELIETASMFVKAKAPRGDRVGVVSESGGMSALMADHCEQAGLKVPPLSDQTREKLRSIMGWRGSAANPADLTRFAAGADFPAIVQHLLAEETQDFLIMASVGEENQARTIIEASARSEKPILFVWAGSSKETEVLPLLQESNVPLFYQFGKGAKAARRLVDYHQKKHQILAERAEGEGTVPTPPAAPLRSLRDMVAAAGRQALTEYDSKRVLSQFGVSVTRELLSSEPNEAVRAAEQIGYPVAVKVISKQLTHKTDAGGVQLGISEASALQAAYDEVLASARAFRPDLPIDGVLVQQMVSGGVEVIVGISRDEQFGPVLMLGIGGIRAEALGAAAWRVCPVNRREARKMIDEVKGLAQILGGYRGRPKADIDALVDTLVRVSWLAVWARDEIMSLDINPLAVLPEGQGAVALDALIIPADQ